MSRRTQKVWYEARPVDEIPPIVWWLDRRERRLSCALASLVLQAEARDFRVMRRSRIVRACQSGPYALEICFRVEGDSVDVGGAL